MKCINATALECNPKPKIKLNAHISTFEDGSTSVLCTAMDRNNPDQCSLTGTVCAYVRGRVEGLLNETAPETAPKSAPETPPDPPKTLTEIIDEAETKAIVDALERHKGDRNNAADELAVSPSTLWRKMTRLEISYGCMVGWGGNDRK